jgi:glycosyltransferase involved in cell wall biosynthesis
MDKFRLAVFNTQPPHLYLGGVERRIIETTKRLQTQAEITVYSGTKSGFKTPTTINGVNFSPINSTDRIYPLDNWSFNCNLTKKIFEIEAEVFEVHAVSGYAIPKVLKKNRATKPLIHTIHGVLADEYEHAKNSGYQTFSSRLANIFMKHLAKLEAETARNATTIVTISKYSVEKIQQYYRVDPGKVQIVPNGVDIEIFKPSNDQEALKHRFNFRKELCILFVGNLVPRKGLTYLIEAAKKIVKERKKVKFLIAGEGPLKNQLIRNIQEANISNSFKFLGRVDEKLLPLLYNCADVFVLPSIQEGQGIVLLEAQASGKPIVAFDVGGAKEAVRNGVTGILVKPGDSNALADALIELIENKTLRERMGFSGRQFIIDNFTWEICAQNMLQVYRRVLAK